MECYRRIYRKFYIVLATRDETVHLFEDGRIAGNLSLKRAMSHIFDSFEGGISYSDLMDMTLWEVLQWYNEANKTNRRKNRAAKKK